MGCSRANLQCSPITIMFLMVTLAPDMIFHWIRQKVFHFGKIISFCATTFFTLSSDFDTADPSCDHVPGNFRGTECGEKSKGCLCTDEGQSSQLLGDDTVPQR